jgi:hypothetical protein
MILSRPVGVVAAVAARPSTTTKMWSMTRGTRRRLVRDWRRSIVVVFSLAEVVPPMIVVVVEVLCAVVSGAHDPV